MPTAEEMQQPYIQHFWVRPGDIKYANPPDVQVEPYQNTTHMPEPMYAASTSAQQSRTQFICDRVYSQQLEEKMDMLRNEFANMRTDFGDQLRQQGSDIDDMKNSIHEILQQLRAQNVRFNS